MTENPFTALERRLERLESILLAIQANHLQSNPNNNSVDNLLTVKEAATFLKLAVPTVYAKVNRLEVPYYKRNKRLYFSEQELREWITISRKKTRQEIESGKTEVIITSRRKSKS